MKINKFEVECELYVSDDGVVTGWFKAPAAPHEKFTIELDLDLILDDELEVEEIAEEEITDNASEQVSGETVDDINVPNPGAVGQVPPF